jgi:serine/threonine protein kinase/tetratricopeptide (TPR) repeat protein
MNAMRLDEEPIFQVARRIADGQARAAYLGQVCGGDAALRGRVERLIRVVELEASFLDVPDFDATVDLPAEVERLGGTVGPYKLLEPIGEGGMGTVYMAEQTHPVRRKVALKVIKPGMDTRQVVAGFESERQALALMDHPNIARVLDAGTTVGGRPYFVMEMVRGVPITKYCDCEKLPVAARLELFILVCRAVQHAHQKGIIHRDLKPSNILVTLHDGVPVPKVIDFGIAKATGQSLTDKTLFTGFAQLVGTPQYMSPEQAEMSGLDVDTRSDIYSLGVLLYELLTGTTPFDGETLERAAFDEMRRIIREEEPPRPSTRLSSLGETLANISANRKIDPRQLNRTVRGELDWIAMKALEKDRRRRYETANDFAADVMRYLTDQPVEACPLSVWYRFSKYARRHRAALTTAGLVTLSLVAGTAVSMWQAALARSIQYQAEAERDRAIRAEQQAAAIGSFLQNDLLLQVEESRQHDDGFFEADKNLTVSEALDRAATRIGHRFRDQPLVEAALRLTIGRAYQGLGQDARSVPHLEQSVRLRTERLGPDHADTLDSLWLLAKSYRFVGRHADSIALIEQLLERRRATLGADNLQTIQTLFRLGEAYEMAGHEAEGERLVRTALARAGGRDPGLEHDFTIRGMRLARRLLAQKKYAEAEPVLRMVVTTRARTMADNWNRFYAMGLLGETLMGQGRRAEAGPFILEGYEGMKSRELTIRSFNKQLLAEAAERAALYREKADDPDVVRRWRERKPPVDPYPIGLR